MRVMPGLTWLMSRSGSPCFERPFDASMAALNELLVRAVRGTVQSSLGVDPFTLELYGVDKS